MVNRFVGLAVKASATGGGNTCIEPCLPCSSRTGVYSLELLWPPCQAPGGTGAMLEPAGWCQYLTAGLLLMVACLTSQQHASLLVGCLTSQEHASVLVGCLTSKQHASVSQGPICSENFMCCHTDIEVADQIFYLTQSLFTDIGPTSPRADPNAT